MIGRKFVFGAAMMLAGTGWAWAQTGIPQTNTFVGPGAPAISADSPRARNPAVNPSAAGLTQGRMANPSTTSAGTLGAEQGAAARSGITAEQARRSLRYYSYAHITDLHLDQNAQWQAQATRNGRRVRVVLDQGGTATEEK